MEWKRLNRERLLRLDEELEDAYGALEAIQVDLAFDGRQRARWAAQNISRAISLVYRAHDHLERIADD
jgi:hypothetical protein